MKIQDVMTRDPRCVTPATSAQAAARIMREENVDAMASEQVRRIPIVDESGSLVGILAQADVVRKASDDRKAEQMVERISEPGGRHSR